MEGNVWAAIGCGLGAAALWGDPDGVASARLGFGKTARALGGLACVALAAAFVLMPAYRPAGPIFKGESWPLVRLKDGQRTTFAEFNGKAVLLNIWGTWCPPCVDELPSLAALRDRVKDRPDIAFAFVAIGSAPEQIAQLFQQQGLDLPVYLPVGPLPAEFRTAGVPATFLLSPDGQIVAQTVGGENWNTPARETELRKLADQAPKKSAAKGAP